MNMIAAGLMILNCAAFAQEPKQGEQVPSPAVSLSDIEPLPLVITAPRETPPAEPSQNETVAGAGSREPNYDSAPFRDSPTTFYHGFDLLGVSRRR